MLSKQKIILIILSIFLLGGIIYYFSIGRPAWRQKNIQKIKEREKQLNQNMPITNEGPVSPISGIACENWNQRPLAIMQASDVSARPPAGLSQADMVFEMPVITASITRLMGVYICNLPPEVGSMRSSRHDFIHLAKGLDAIYVHWGGSHFAKEILNEKVIDNLNCNDDGGQSAGKCCFRKTGMKRGVDSGYAHPQKLLECAQEFNYSLKGNFSGYPHQKELARNERPKGGHLRVGFAGAYGVSYDYDPETNTYLRTWGGKEDADRNNGQRIAPKNVVVMIAQSEQIEGQYNNVQLGDPWYDVIESGEAHYYFNGKVYNGTWKKDKANIGSKLFFYDDRGEEIKFVPGQIWVEILEPGQNLKWTPAT